MQSSSAYPGNMESMLPSSTVLKHVTAAVLNANYMNEQ